MVAHLHGQSRVERGRMMQRQRFHMENPIGFNEDGFVIYADEDVLDYLKELPQVASMMRYATIAGRAMVHLSPQYDLVEAWCNIYDALTDYVRSEDLLQGCFGEADDASSTA